MGDARSPATGPRRPGKARRGRPGSQETSLRPPSRTTLVERGGSQHEAQPHRRHGRRTPLARSQRRRSPRPPTVDLRVEGATRTLFEGRGDDRRAAVPVRRRPRTLLGHQRRRARSRRGASRRAPSRSARTGTTGSATRRSTTIDGRERRLRRRRRSATSEYQRHELATIGRLRRPELRRATRSCSPYAARSTDTAARTLSRPGARPSRGETVDADGHRRGHRRRPSRARPSPARPPAPTARSTVGPWTTRGGHDLKAIDGTAVRSNRVRVVRDRRRRRRVRDDARRPRRGAPAPPAAAARPRRADRHADRSARQADASRRGPRELRGSLGADPSGIKTVKLRLTKRARQEVLVLLGQAWSASAARSAGAARTSRSATAPTGRYLLPARARARAATCSTRSRSTARATARRSQRGTTRVVFTVR